MLEVRKLTQKYGEFYALRDVSFSVGEDEIKGIIGPNGAGKTTLINAVTGISRPSAGEIYFEGRRIDGKKTWEIAHLGVARTFQNLRLFDGMTVLDNVRAAQTMNLPAAARLDVLGNGEKTLEAEAMELLAFLGIERLAGDVAGELSYGDKRRVEMARALATRPRLLILDEPGAGMNPKESQELIAVIRRVNREKKAAILLIEHDMDVIMALCQSVVVLNYGEKLTEGPYEEIRRNPQVVEAYLGVQDSEGGKEGAAHD